MNKVLLVLASLALLLVQFSNSASIDVAKPHHEKDAVDTQDHVVDTKDHVVDPVDHVVEDPVDPVVDVADPVDPVDPVPDVEEVADVSCRVKIDQLKEAGKSADASYKTAIEERNRAVSFQKEAVDGQKMAQEKHIANAKEVDRLRKRLASALAKFKETESHLKATRDETRKAVQETNLAKQKVKEEQHKRDRIRKDRISTIEECKRLAEEEAQRIKDAEEARKLKEAEEEAQRIKDAEEEAQRIKDAEEAARKQKEAEEEAQRIKDAEEAKRIKEAEEEAQRIKDAEEAARKQKEAEEEAERIRKAKEDADKEIKEIINPPKEFDCMRKGAKKDGFYRNPYDCKAFYRCVHEHGKWTLYEYKKRCEGGHLFSSELQTCTFPHDTDPCANIQPPTKA